MRTRRRSVIALVAAAVLAVPATAGAITPNKISTAENWPTPNPYTNQFAGQAGWMLWADDGIADVRISVRDTASDGWCARSYIEWHTTSGSVIQSKTVASCTGSWTRVYATPLTGGRPPALSKLYGIMVYRWSGPELYQPKVRDLQFCLRGVRWIYEQPCLNRWNP